MKISAKTFVQSITLTEKEFLHKAKEFLKEKAQAAVPVGLQLKTAGAENIYAVAYERERFVIVLPEGKGEAARLYGNWDEALFVLKKLLTKKQINDQILLTEYNPI